MVKKIMKGKMFLLLLSVFLVGLVSALPVYLAPLDGSGHLQPDMVFNYTFNFTTEASCSGVLISNKRVITTDSRGMGFVELNLSGLTERPNYLCKYRNGVLRRVYNFSDVVFGKVWASGLNVAGDANVSGNLDAKYFVGDGSKLTGLPTAGNSSWNQSLADSLYYGVANSFGFYNSTTLGFLSQLTNNLGIGNWSADKSYYVPYAGADRELDLGNNDFKVGSGLFVNGTSGLIGLGTVTPSVRLDVSGDAKISGNLTAGRLSGDGSGLTNLNLDGHKSSFFMPLNKSVVGDFDFNGGWTSGGLSISKGDLYAQTLYVYNITSLGVNMLNVNGSMVPASGFDNTFDIGNSSLRWRDGFFGRDVYVGGDLDVGSGGFVVKSGDVGIGTSTPTSKLNVVGGMNISSSGTEVRVESNGDVNVFLG